MQDVNIETAIQYAVDFMHIVGVPQMFESKEVDIEIHNFKGQLPCDLVSIEQVKDMCTGLCMRSMTDSFDPTDDKKCGCASKCSEGTFKLQNTVIVTSFKEGKIKIAYNAAPVDENGYPLVLDNPAFLKALELYIKREVFTVLYDLGKIQPGPLQNTQQEYAWRVGQLQSELTIPSLSEMESLRRSWCTLIQRTTEFKTGFKYNGNQEYIKTH